MSHAVNLTITQGKTFAEALLYADDERLYLPIAGMPSRAPVRLSVPGHGLPDDWPVQIAGIKAPSELNSEGDAVRFIRVIDADTVELNDLHALNWRQYGGGGVLICRKPIDLTGWQARAQVRDKLGGELLFAWHSDPATNPDGLIEIEGAKLTLHMDAEASAALTWKRGVYDAEIIAPTGEVYALVAPSTVTVVAEVTV